ncbi:SHOCT domain-containing protein [Haloarcula salinisoli]|nr:SHOCT domain-containing protein [Halomicroarcula salinisoli]
MAVLRERYARGDLSDDEFERRREQLERSLSNRSRSDSGGTVPARNSSGHYC